MNHSPLERDVPYITIAIGTIGDVIWGDPLDKQIYITSAPA